MKRADFHYDLPGSLIAQEPVDPRDHSRLLVVDRSSRTLQHRRFHEIAEFLRAGDVLVLNTTKVFPARLRGKKKTGGKAEVLLLEPLLPSREKVGMRDGLDNENHPSPQSSPLKGEEIEWRGLVRGTVKPVDLEFPEGLLARMTKRLNNGEWVLKFSRNSLRSYLDEHGEMPLPPYIKRPAPRGLDRDRYQTVYAEAEGAVAAPTAGFHFTPELLDRLRSQGVQTQQVTLHVGWGTFRPVRSETIEEHTMLPEMYEVSEETAQVLTQARRERRRVIAVGTTVVRTLETIVRDDGTFCPGKGQASLFIYPGYRFKAVDALITNFHLPDATPLLLACAFFGSDQTNPFSLHFAYDEAIREGYRFYSYGDAMFIS